MLTELSIENFALIEQVRLEFASGLNVLTGETGAGKSILLDALGMALGERTGTEVVRHGADRARVEAIFSFDKTPDERLLQAVQNVGAQIEDNLLLLSRELAGGGKSVARINGRPATVGMLKTIGDALVDIHGQHAHQSLLDAARHGEILDAWAGDKVLALKHNVAAAHRQALAAERELSALRQDARERARMLDLYQFQQEEITDAAPVPGEDETLIAERLRLSSAEKLHLAAASAHALLSGGDAKSERGALDNLSDAAREIEAAARLDDNLAPVLEALQNALYVAEDAARDVRNYRDEVEFNPERLQEIETRLDTLKTLMRKYGETLEEVLRYQDEISAKLDTLENAEERIAHLETLVEKARTERDAVAAQLTAARKKAAKPFAAAIQRELKDLAMSATRFEVAIEPVAPTLEGADAVEFLISPNPGEPLRPLAKIASGGEISRIMLAMKSVLARILRIPTLIFDEVDAGIGGRTGVVLAEKLCALGAAGQILCITHLPAIAARGARHLLIEKQASGKRTTVAVAALDAEPRVTEIARMLGGTDDNETVVRHAREMLAGRPAAAS